MGVPALPHRRECNQSRVADSEQLVGRCPVDRKSNRTTGKVLWHWSHSWWDTSSDSSKALPQELEIPDFYLPEGFAMLAGGHPVAPSPDQDVQKWPIDGIQTWHCPFPHQTRTACQLPSNLHASASPSSEKCLHRQGDLRWLHIQYVHYVGDYHFWRQSLWGDLLIFDENPICTKQNKGGRGLWSSHKLQTKMSHPFSQKLSVPNLTGIVTLHIYIKRKYIMYIHKKDHTYICI